MARKAMPADAGIDQAPRLPTAGSPSAVTANEEKNRRNAALRKVPLLKLRAHEYQPPERHAPERVTELMVSIDAHGLLQPPLISWRGDGSRVVLAGHRRVKACQLLALDGKHEDRIPAYVLRDLSEETELDLVLVEQMHRDEDYSVVTLAENIGRKWTARQRELGRDVSIRDLADCIPSAAKTAVGEYVAIFRALKDPRLGPLVRQADKAGKSLLYRAIRLDDFRSRKAALEAFVEGGSGAMRKAVQQASKRGRPKMPFTRRKRGDGYDLTIRYRPEMTSEDAAQALEQIEQLEAALRSLASS